MRVCTSCTLCAGVEESKGGEPEDDDAEEAVEPAPASRGKKRASKK
jgi:hypothetical protein